MSETTYSAACSFATEIRITEYLKLEGTHKDYQVQLPKMLPEYFGEVDL